MKGQLSEKLYYSIGELAEYLDVKTSLIRYWEKEFEVLNPKKKRKRNQAIFDQRRRAPKNNLFVS
jgi:DNA-binding transcriptional MerR regulator